MAKKKGFKLDTTRAKEFLMAKGERVGLMGSAGLMVLLLLSSVWMGLGIKSDHEQLKKAAQAKLSQVNNNNKEPPSSGEENTKAAKPDSSWNPIGADAFPITAGFFDSGAITEDKFYNPYALALVGSDKSLDDRKAFMKVDVVRAPVKVHKVSGSKVDVLQSKAGAGSGGAVIGGGSETQAVHPVSYIEPKRLIVVSALFPYQEQLEVYKKIFRKDSIKEVLADEKLAPKFLGLNVVRYELRDGQVVPESQTWLFLNNATEKKGPAHTAWLDFMKFAKFDAHAYQSVQKYVEPGLVTPLPELANGNYPDIDLEGLKIDKKTEVTKGDGALNPMGGGPGVGGLPGLPGQPDPKKPAGGSGGVISELELKELAKSDKALAAKLKGTFEIFSPTGEKAGDKKLPGGNIPFQPGGSSPNPGGTTPPMPGTTGGDDGDKKKDPPEGVEGKETTEYLLVRFVDVNVEPGKTYFYGIQVRLQNPNFGKKDKVAIPYLATIPELLSYPPSWTPPQRVDEEYFYYVVDQFQLSKGSASKPMTHPGTKDTALASTANKNSEMVAVQLHRWVENGQSSTTGKLEYKVGGWAVAERLIAKKGMYLGKTNLEVPLPYWKDTQEAYHLPELAKDKNKNPIIKSPEKAPGVIVAEYTALQVDMQPPALAPLVVDFKGGENDYWYLPGDKANSMNEKAAVHLLVLSPDGKLLSFNSRDDSDEKTPRGQERLEHYQHWQDLNFPPTNTKKAGGLPGVPGSPPGVGPK